MEGIAAKPIAVLTPSDNIWMKSAQFPVVGPATTSGRKIAWGSPKIFPKGRYSGQDFLYSYPKD